MEIIGDKPNQIPLQCFDCSKEIETILKKPLSEQTAEDRKKWAKWVAQEEKPKKQTETSPDLKPEAVKATNDETNQSAPSQS